MDEAPPSFTSVRPANIDHDQQHSFSVTDDPNAQFDQQNHSNPSMSKIRSYLSFEAGTTAAGGTTVQPTEPYDDDGYDQALSIGAMVVCRTEDEQLTDSTSNYENNEQPPSMGFMVGDRGNSQPGGGGNFITYNAPPSQSDVARRDESYKGEGESNGGGENNLLPEGDYEEVSLTGPNFAKLYPMMYGYP
ncbi:hypothetical protein SSX86_019535 [Deinandra increscens subsp. villosa]|uniref:Uncharacterized protein n=1 Tax=Deinandra increscens subsp. villosa TaxID=3103831 RepID=A0AAP0D001_9ASTR